ncbi:MAG: DUF1573 domain-containing protein [Pseudomonadota bacterium]
MRFIIIIFLITVSMYSCKQIQDNKLDTDLINNPVSADAKIDTDKLPLIVFDTLEHDFGNINEGDQATFEFKFKNLGKGSLLITEVHATCGCTTPYYPKNIIKPEEGDVIKVIYNSTGRPGKFSKGITVTANTYPNTTKLKISGTVIPKP